MKSLLIISTILLVGCQGVPKKSKTSTDKVGLTSKEIETSVIDADNSNSKASSNVDKALSLNERIDAILLKLEK